MADAQSMRMATRVNLLLAEDVVAALDRVAGLRGRSRYVAQAVRERIRRDERLAVAREAAGSWRDHPLFPTSDGVLEWVRAVRAERTDATPTSSDS